MMKLKRTTLKRTRPLAITMALMIAAAFLGCDNRYSTATLIINEIIDPIGANPTVFVALSRKPDFKGGMKTLATSYDLASPQTPAVTFESVTWENPDELEAGEFWLLVAEDANSTNLIDDMDNILPAMRVLLKDGQTTTIERIIFDSSIGPPAKHVHSVAFIDPNRLFRIFVEDPSLISMTSKMYVRLGNVVDLSAAASAVMDIPIADPAVSSGLSLRTSMANGFIWIDANGNGILQSGDGDWISTVSPAAAPPLADINDIILYAGRVWP